MGIESAAVMSEWRLQIQDAEHNIEIIAQLAGSGGTLLDLGANIGEVSIRLADQFDRIIAVEGNPKTFKIMLDRIAASGKDTKIVPIMAIVAPRDDEIRYMSDPSEAGVDAIAHSVCPIDGEKYFAVSTVAFSPLVERYAARAVKMDIEASEFEIIEQCEFPPCISFLLVEFHWQVQRAEQCMNLLKEKHGFHCFAVYPDHELSTVVMMRGAE